MTKPTRKVTKTETIETEVPDLPETTPEVTKEKTGTGRHCPNPMDYEYYFKEFLKSIGGNIDDSTVYIYRKSGQGTGRAYAAIAKWKGSIPDYDTLAIEFGAGTYRLTLAAYDKDDKRIDDTVEFCIEHTPYLQKMREREGAITSAAVNNQMVTSNNNSDAFAMLDRLMSILTPLINRPAAAVVSAPNDISMVREMAKGMSDIMKDNVKNQLDMVRDFSKQAARIPFIQGDDDDETKPEKEEKGGIMDVIEKFMPLVEKFLPGILGNKPGSEMLVEAVKLAPDFQNIIQDKTKLIAFVREIEKKVGPEETQAALNKFGIKL